MADNGPRVLADFEGLWRVARRIDQADLPPGRFEGRAEWRRARDGLQYEERGQLMIPGHPTMQAERRYFWGPDLRVYFDDGRFFHQVPPEGGATGHWCEPDQYDVTYDFAAWPQFRVTWKVSGPRKAYCMVTDYSRKTPPEA